MPRPSIAPQRREEILQAFETCALRKGLDATTLNDVAAEAQIPRSLVRHFMGNREEMVAGLIERMFARATSAVEQALLTTDDGHDADLVQIILNQQFADPISSKLMIQLWQKSWQDDALREQIADVYRRCVAQIHDQLYPDGDAASHDLAYALTALATGHAVFQQFGLSPHDGDRLAQAGQAITQLSNHLSNQLSNPATRKNAR